MKFFLTAMMICFFSFTAKAVKFEMGTMLLSDKTDAGNTSAKADKIIYDLAILMTSEGKSVFGIGWSFDMVTTKDEGTSTVKYSSTETGPIFTYQFGRSKEWYLGFTYNLTAKSKYNDGTTENEWRGTSTKLTVGYVPSVTDRLQVGMKLNYHAASYNEEISGSTTLASASNKKSMIYPTLAFIYSF